MYLAQEK